MYVIFIVAIIAALMIWRSRSNGHSLTMETIAEGLSNGGQLIDVRTAAEYKGGHAKGARNVSLQSLQAGVSIGDDRAKPVYLYCHSGARAAAAKTILRRNGYTNVVNIGGIHAWKRMGGKVTG